MFCLQSLSTGIDMRRALLEDKRLSDKIYIIHELLALWRYNEPL